MRSLQSQNQDICFVAVDQLAPGVTLHGTHSLQCALAEKNSFIYYNQIKKIIVVISINLEHDEKGNYLSLSNNIMNDV